MIQPKDLRIGNLVYDTSVGGDPKIVQISSVDNNFAPTWAKPIPITEDVLPNIAGFKEDGDGVMLMFDTDKYTITMIYYDGWNLSYEEKDGFGCGECHLKGSWSLHEFQNLFHALTNNELNIKNNA